MQDRLVRKANERGYYRRIGPEGISHGLSKPFTDSTRGQLLLNFGAVLSLMPQQPPARVLDLGCGTGWTSDFLARSGYETTGIDLSPEAVEAAAATYPSQNLRFLVHDYEEPLGEEGTYDIALFFDALHHCTDVEAALKTAASALRHGGACVVSEPGRGHANSGTSVEARDLYDVTERDMPPEVVIAAARKAGFARSRVYPQPAEVQRLLYTPTGERRSGIRQLLDSRVGRSLLILRAMHLNRRRGGLVLLEL